jgi:hypothetical protein
MSQNVSERMIRPPRTQRKPPLRRRRDGAKVRGSFDCVPWAFGTSLPRRLTWQGQADYWAAKEGMPRVFGHDARRLTLRGDASLQTVSEQLVKGNVDYLEVLTGRYFPPDPGISI